MEFFVQIGIFVVALAVLLKSSDFFVDKAEKIGLSFGISPFVIGITIVAFGTSLPELATSVVAVLKDNSEIVLGTVVGSNITNILLVLGFTLVVGKTIHIQHDIMDIDMPLLLLSSLFCYFVLKDEYFSMIEAILFIVSLILFLLNSLKGNNQAASEERTSVHIFDYVILLLAGIGVSLGASYTVSSISALSEIAGVPADIISLSVLAFGTSLPEVVVSVAAARKGKHAIAVGNVLGSNIFNTYAVLGIARLFGDLKVTHEILQNSLPIMIGVTILFAIVCVSRKISRWEGAMFIVMYCYYISTLIPTA